MNVKEYISSGAIESYVLGMATAAEQQELEELCARYPEIAAARTAFELALEQQLLQEAVPPPAGIKTALMEKLQQEAAGTAAAPAPAEAPVRHLQPWRWVAAASLLLLAGATWWAVQTTRRYQALKSSEARLQQQLQQQTAELQAMKTDAGMLRREGLKMAAMHGPTNPAVYSTIYWDTLTKDVYLMINNLPAPASNQQYQLWALLDGKPIDLGVIEAKQERLLYRMKNVQQAQAFAITLEPKGGSQTPTSSPIVVSNL